MKTDSILYWIFGTLHGYASLIIGAILFHKFVYPHCYLDPSSMKGLTEAIPIYALNFLAFGSMVYLATHPVFLLLNHLLNRILNAFEKLADR